MNIHYEGISINRLRRPTQPSGRGWEKLWLFSLAIGLSDLCFEMDGMMDEDSDETRNTSRASIKTLLISLKLLFDGGWQLSDDEKRTVVKQLRNAGCPENIPLNDAKLLMELVGGNMKN